MGLKSNRLISLQNFLFPNVGIKEGEEEFTVMKVIVEGEKDKKKVRYTYNLLDRHDKKTNIHSMARTTGYTATTVVRLLAKGMFDQKGICPLSISDKNLNVLILF